MIYIDREDNVVGSKFYTRELAEILRPLFKELLDNEGFEIFESDALYHSTIWIDTFSAEQFMKTFHFIKDNPIEKFQHEHLILIEWMKKDPRYSEEPTK